MVNALIGDAGIWPDPYVQAIFSKVVWPAPIDARFARRPTGCSTRTNASWYRRLRRISDPSRPLFLNTTLAQCLWALTTCSKKNDSDFGKSASHEKDRSSFGSILLYTKLLRRDGRKLAPDRINLRVSKLGHRRYEYPEATNSSRRKTSPFDFNSDKGPI